MRTLPPFPVDDFTLDQVEHALGAHIASIDDDGNPVIGGADFTLSRLLDFMAGVDPGNVTLLHDGPIPVYESHDVHYTKQDVIRSLIVEVRRLRAIVSS